MRNTQFTIGKLSKITGCVVQTIRYYEQIGLLPEPPRSVRGHRLYNTKSLNRLMFILRTRQLGFNLAETQELLRLVDGGHYTCHEIKVKTLMQARKISQKIKDLEKMKIDLLDMAENCHDSLSTNCSILDILFHEPPS